MTCCVVLTTPDVLGFLSVRTRHVTVRTSLKETAMPAVRRSIELLLVATVALAPSVAQAHFILEEPASWREQGPLGDPQKLGPCGDDGTGEATGTVTAFKAGETITVKVNEMVFHPGHYRVALAVNDRSELPAEPVVTPGSTPCGSVPIESSPAFPVLADGVLQHTQPFDEPQSFQVTLPADVTCEKCTLQVIEFMSNHPLNNPGGCFYHHCADISIHADSTPSGEASDAGKGGCSSGVASPEAFALIGLGLVTWARRRRSVR
jgi:MYXO-CTERM domain-containing protein